MIPKHTLSLIDKLSNFFSANHKILKKSTEAAITEFANLQTIFLLFKNKINLIFATNSTKWKK